MSTATDSCPAGSAAAAAPLDVLIVGGGVCGTALLFELARYTDLRRVALVERYDRLALVNSRATNNSQTIHCGDIETNYTLEKALRVKRTAEMIVRYAELLDPATRERCVFRTPKMVLGVGPAECAFLRERFARFSPHFPAMELLDKQAIAEWEPSVALVDGSPRPEDLVAIGIRRTYTAVDYEALAASFVDQARAAVEHTDREILLKLGTSVCRITPEGEGYRVSLMPTPGGQGAGLGSPEQACREVWARHVVVNAGAHSLLMAQAMGYGLEYSCLPVAGSFYFTPDLLRGKVYTVQNDKLPFAAIHGDPDVRAPGKTRFGPTALLLPQLERYRPASFWEFLKVLRLDWAVLAVFWQLLRIADIRNYILKNLLFEVPWLRRRLFLADVRKIVPGMKLQDLSFAEGYGGVRPQLIDKRQRRLMLGEASIEAEPGLVFNVTPSPGGTCCLGNAARDLERIVARLGCRFDRERLERELHGDAGDEPGSAGGSGPTAEQVGVAG
ncbi:FAD-dependent oxidoreductase [Cyanobium sp. NIES-981]|uniref:FAD-dependent oxidoreductase n=1 Tax=Cyanobium sp. NIES-981 TaxID=1851505 RepID=UPI0007DD4DCB|nr:FAD-dependent oxidoreductase [Cyanobium sp. NIES-981]SBO42990.1 putative malate:quinone oxidoreductase [Cyanobium sp. NIES-981]